MEFMITEEVLSDPSFGVRGIAPEKGERFYIMLSKEGEHVLSAHLGSPRTNPAQWAEDCPVRDLITGEQGFRSWEVICRVFGECLAEGKQPFASDRVHIHR